MLCKRLKAQTVMNLNNEYQKLYSCKTEESRICKILAIYAQRCCLVSMTIFYKNVHTYIYCGKKLVSKVSLTIHVNASF